MIWWQEAGVECICPAPPHPRSSYFKDPPRPHRLRTHHHHGSHCLVRVPVIPGDATHTHTGLSKTLRLKPESPWP